MDVQITPTKLAGHVHLPASKSHCHRLLIASYLAGSLESGKKEVDTANNENQSDDIAVTIEALKQLETSQNPTIHCKESGSTLRFLLPVAAVLKDSSRFYGQGRLPKRPISPLLQQLEAHGCKMENHIASSLICQHRGRLQGGTFFLPGDISSQFITGLLFALPLTGSGGSIHLTTPLESRSYVDLTRKVLLDFGIAIQERTGEKGFPLYHVPGNQHYRFPCDISLLQPEPDWSAAAFWYVANELGSHISINEKAGASMDFSRSLQGDKAITDIISRRSSAKTIDASDIPDLIPIIAVLLAMTPGRHEIIHAGRLRLKESNRLHTITTGLKALGAVVMEKEDGLVILGKRQLRGGTVQGAEDHRIIMAMAIAAIGCKDPVTIHGAQAVTKSYPLFFQHYTELGGRIEIR